MRQLLTIAAAFLTLNAYATPATQESVEALLAATKTEAVMDSMYSNMEQMMRQGMAQSTRDTPLSGEQQRTLDALPTKFVAIMREELNWQKMKPLYVQLHRDTFEQDEVDGLVAFYASPTGKAFVNKMPLLVQKSLALSQSLMQSFMPKMAAAMKSAMEEASVNH